MSGVCSYHKVKEQPKLWLAMTGLRYAEFHQLLPHFQYAWDQYVTQHDADRDDRQRQYGAGRSESTLVPIEDKLLFILYDVKVYPRHIGKNLSSLPDFSIIIAAKEGLQ